jgi:hypothetical protein
MAMALRRPGERPREHFDREAGAPAPAPDAEAGLPARPIPEVFEDAGAPAGEEPVTVEAGAVSLSSLDAIIVEAEPGEALAARAAGAPEADEGDEHAVEGYIDMGETWGYTDDGKLRTVRDESGEAPAPPPREGERDVERPAARKRAAGGGERHAGPEKRGSGKSAREHGKRGGSRT